MKHILKGILLLICYINYGQQSPINVSKDKLEFFGTLTFSGKSNFEMSECLSENAMILDIESKTKSEKEAITSSFVKGAYSYAYYVNHYDTQAGNVDFKFEFLIENNTIKYRYYDFIHQKSDSAFESIGLLPKDWNENIKQFTKAQYAEIQTDILLNVAGAIKRIQNYCLKN